MQGSGSLVPVLRADDPVAPVFHAEAACVAPPERVVLVPPPAGGMRVQNVALVRAALSALGEGALNDATTARALARLPARMEVFDVAHARRRVRVLLDGAHVAHSVTAALRERGAARVAVLAAGADEDCVAIGRALRAADMRAVYATAAGTVSVYAPPHAVADALRAAGYATDEVNTVR